MTNALQIFTYKNNEVRTAEVDGEVWFVAKDVCDILDIANSRDAISELDDDEKNTVAINDGNRGNPNTNIISESGVYALVFKSRKPEAKAFSRWVRHEVLPQIRKTGTYNAQPLNIRAAEVLKNTVQYLISSEEKRAFTREIYRLVTGQELPKKEPATKTAHTPRIWTAQQIAATLKWTTEAVIHRADDLGIGYWDGETLCFSKTDRTNFLDLVNKGVIKIKDGYEYYEGGFKRIHWSFDADAAETLLRGEE